MTCATFCKLISWSNDALNARKRQFCEKLDFQNSSKMAIFTPKFLENGFERLWKRKNRHLLTFGSIEIDSRIVWSPRLILRIPWVPNKSSKAIKGIRGRTIFFRALQAQPWRFLESIFWCKTCNFSSFLKKILEKLEKLTTHGRLRAPKSFETSYDHAKHLVG